MMPDRSRSKECWPTDLGLQECLFSGKSEIILYWFSIDGANNQIQSQGLAEAKVVLERRRGQYEK